MDFDDIRSYRESMEQYYSKHSNNTDSYSDPNNQKNKYSTPLKDSYRNSFTNVNSDSNNSENNPFTNVDPDYNKSEKKYATYTDSFSNENSANPNKSSGFFIYEESPLLWDEATQTLRRNPNVNHNKYSRSFTYADSKDSVDNIWPEEIHSSYWPK